MHVLASKCKECNDLLVCKHLHKLRIQVAEKTQRSILQHCEYIVFKCKLRIPITRIRWILFIQLYPWHFSWQMFSLMCPQLPMEYICMWRLWMMIKRATPIGDMRNEYSSSWPMQTFLPEVCSRPSWKSSTYLHLISYIITPHRPSWTRPCIICLQYSQEHTQHDTNMYMMHVYKHLRLLNFPSLQAKRKK